MSLVSKLKSVFNFVKKPIAKILPSKATLKGIGTKIKSSKIGSIFGTKGGKIGLAVAGGAALIGGSIFLYNKLSGSKSGSDLSSDPNKKIGHVTIVKAEEEDKDKKAEDKSVPNKKDEEKVEPDQKDGEKVPPNKKDDGKLGPNKDDNEKVGPNKKDDGKVPTSKKDDDDSVEPKSNDDGNAKPNRQPKYHTVVKGDNVWNIAKAHLREMNKKDPNYRPTNAEILEHTKELIAANKLHFEPDNYHVMIRPGDRLVLEA